MNITVVSSEGYGRLYIHQTLLDYISGNTLIITRNSETQQSWRLSIVSANSTPDNVPKRTLDSIFREFHFLNGYGMNPDAYDISTRFYDNVIIDDVWMVYQAAVISTWISRVKTANPAINFIGISETIGESYKTRIDPRITDIELVFASRLKATLESKLENKPIKAPQHVLHIIKNDMLHDKTIHSISYSPNGKHFALTSCIDIGVFAEDIFEFKDREISAFAPIPRCIDELYKAMNLLSTAMTFDPSADKGKAMGFLSSQLNSLLFSLDRQNLTNSKLLDAMQVSMRDQKNIIFCDIKQSDFLRQYTNWYLKRRFGDQTLGFAIDSFLKKKYSTLCIEDRSYEPTEEILKGCDNVLLFGSNKYDRGLILDIHAKAKGDLNIITFVTPKTIDESNVLMAVKGIEDNSLTILTHDLSS